MRAGVLMPLLVLGQCCCALAQTYRDSYPTAPPANPERFVPASYNNTLAAPQGCPAPTGCGAPVGCGAGCPPEAPCGGQPYAAPPAGMFTAPPPVGDVAGESQTVGVRGFAIRIPPMHLELPTIQLPALIRYRRDAEMIFSEGRAPYSYGPAAVYGQIAPGGQTFAAPYAAPPGTPYSAPCNNAAHSSGYSQSYAEALNNEHELRKQLEDKDYQIKRMQIDLQRLQAIEECLKRLSSAQGQNGNAAPPSHYDPPPLPPSRGNRQMNSGRAIEMGEQSVRSAHPGHGFGGEVSTAAYQAAPGGTALPNGLPPQEGHYPATAQRGARITGVRVLPSVSPETPR